MPAFIGATGVIYTIPSIALFLLLLPISGRGTLTALIALTLYTLQIIYRNIVTGLANVPAASKDAGRGMGMTDRQLLWRVELPLAVPEIIAGLRIATVSTVAIATLAVFAGAGGLGDVIYTEAPSGFQDRDRGRQRARDRDGDLLRRPLHRRPAAALALAPGPTRMSATLTVGSVFDSFSGAIEFIFSSRESVGVGAPVGGLDQVAEFLWTHVWISALALAIAVAIALPVGVWLGHRGAGELLAVAVGNAGRAIPELALIALMIAFVGVGVLNVTIALLILGIPPILTNAFVGIRQVDRDAVEAARGMGMTELEVITRVELPLAVPTIMSGVRTGGDQRSSPRRRSRRLPA